MQPSAIFLTGPTASGKTDLALHLVTRFPLKIISVDSAQVYRHLNIGTAKPTADMLARVPHRLINIKDPHQTYSAAEFRLDALAAMAEISATAHVPLLVGGTGLYFRALRYGLSSLPSADATLRAQLTQQAQERGWSAMHADLASIDPQAAQKIHPHDAQRIQRALEVWHLTHKPLSAQQRGPQQTALPYRVLILACAPREREILRTRIATRFHTMLTQGLEHEVRELLASKNLNPTTPALRSVGYRQMIEYVQGLITWNEMVEQAITATRGLAKRQLTWLRAETELHWLYDEDGDPIARCSELIANWLSH